MTTRFELTDDQYSDVIHCVNQAVEADRGRSNELHEGGLGKFAVVFEEQEARLRRLKTALENIYENA
jgi:hypothetical protein